jgi:hypothetical protein
MAVINLHNYEAYLLDYFEGNLDKELEGELKAFVMAHPELEVDMDGDLPVFSKEDIGFDFKNELLKTEDNIPGEELLNYLEGNLGPAEKLRLEKRLSQDADLARELELLKKTILIPELSEVLSLKNELIKNEDQFVLNNLVIAYFEKTLNREETVAFEKALASEKNLRDELALVEKTRLVADASLVYPGKDGLKKEARVIALFNYRVAVAAAVLLVLGLAVFFMVNNNPSKNLSEPQLAKKEINSNAKSNAVHAKKEIAAETNSLVATKDFIPTKKAGNPVFNKQPVHTSTVLIANQQSTLSPVISNEDKMDTTALAGHEVKKENKNNEPVNEAPVMRYTNIDALAVSTDTDEDIEPVNKPAKNGFWKRAVKVAQQMNGLGVKAVKGDEKENENYSLSFNSFSVEKK